MSPTAEKLRLDKYLWAIRFFKTRSQAAAACNSGKVKFNGLNAKAARQVHNIDDEYEVKTEAINYYSDITPAEEIERLKFQAAGFHTGKQPGKIGRPVKKQRSDMDDFLKT